jgi:hypothetical protein
MALIASAADPITGMEAVDLFTAGDNYSRGVCSRHVGQRRPQLVTAADHQVIHVADRSGINVDQNFVWRRAWLWRFTDGQCLNPVEAVAKDCAQKNLRNLHEDGAERRLLSGVKRTLLQWVKSRQVLSDAH